MYVTCCGSCCTICIGRYCKQIVTLILMAECAEITSCLIVAWCLLYDAAVMCCARRPLSIVSWCIEVWLAGWKCDRTYLPFSFSRCHVGQTPAAAVILVY